MGPLGLPPPKNVRGILDTLRRIQRRMQDQQWNSQLRDPRRQVMTRQVFDKTLANYERPAGQQYLCLSLRKAAYSTGGKSTSVPLIRLKVLVKMVSAMASEISANWVSVYPAARIAVNSSWLIVPLVVCR